MIHLTPSEKRVAEQFPKDVAGHRLTVLHSDGLYRHLRCKKPGTSLYWFEIVTWPGVLVVSGDMGTYVFARTDDMLSFFRNSQGWINPKYWAEKEQTGARVREYDPDLAKRVTTDSLDGFEPWDDEGIIRGLRNTAEKELFERPEWQDESGARALLDNFEYRGFRFPDVWEWNLTDWTYRYLWCCHAIVWAIDRYDEQQATKAMTQPAQRVETLAAL